MEQRLESFGFLRWVGSRKKARKKPKLLLLVVRGETRFVERNPGSSFNDFRNKTLQKQAFGTVIAHLLAASSQNVILKTSCAKIVFQSQVRKHYVYSGFLRFYNLEKMRFLVKSVGITKTDDFRSGGKKLSECPFW